jgi:phenylalanyl-tRNA synthetase beta chain
VLLDGEAIGFVGELHPRWRQSWDLPQAPVLFELSLDAVTRRDVPQARGVGRQQPVERDIAVIVQEGVTHAAVQDAIASADTSGLLRNALLFDVFRPQPARGGQPAVTGGLSEGEKSLAVRLTLSGDDATLTEAQIETAVQGIVSALGDKLGARLRG